MAAGCPHCGDWKHLGTECPKKPKGWKPGMPGLLEETRRGTTEGQHERKDREKAGEGLPEMARRVDQGAPEERAERESEERTGPKTHNRPRNRKGRAPKEAPSPQGQESREEASKGERLVQTRNKAAYRAYQREYQRKHRARVKAQLEELKRLKAKL